MAYGKKENRRKRKRFKRRGKKKSSGRKLLRDARRPGIQSAAELAVKIIAQKEIQKTMTPNLIFRRFAFGEYNRTTNQFLNPTLVDINGVIVHMAQIPIWDIQTQLTVVPTADPMLRPTVPLYPRGVNTLAPYVDQEGYRSSNRIQIKNISAQLRFTLDPYDAHNIPARKEFIQVDYAIILVSHPDMSQIGWKPGVNEVMPFKGWGHSSRLDTVLVDKETLKQKTLKRGSCKIFHKEYVPQEVYKNLFLECNLPYEYEPFDAEAGTQGDQNGQKVVSAWKIFLVVRTDSPPATDANNKLGVHACMKIGYRNVA